MLITFLLLFLPLLLTALVHHFVIIPRNLFSSLTSPLDGNIVVSEKPLFGPSKTVRGVVVMTVGTALVCALLSLFLPANQSFLKVAPFLAGLINGFFYSIGELPTSFIKRRLQLHSSDQRRDFTGVLLYLLEQSDSIIAVMIACLLTLNLTAIPLLIVFLAGAVGILTHIIIDLLLHVGGYKKNASKPFFWKLTAKQ